MEASYIHLQYSGREIVECDLGFKSFTGFSFNKINRK